MTGQVATSEAAVTDADFHGRVIVEAILVSDFALLADYQDVVILLWYCCDIIMGGYMLRYTSVSIETNILHFFCAVRSYGRLINKTTITKETCEHLSSHVRLS